jgi:PAS domain S-box-containing protein
VTRFITHVIDISDRKRAEQLHSRADQTLRRLMEGLQGEYFFYGRRADGGFSYVSPSIENVLGYSPEEVLEHFFDHLAAGDVREECVRRMELGVRGVRQPPFAAEMRHKDGTVHWLEVVELPAMEGERCVGVDGIAHDTTSRRALELEVNHMRKLQAIGQLAAGIAHEINTPVQYVGDSLHFLKEAFEDLARLVPRYREAVRELASAGAGQRLIAELGEIEEDVDLDDLLATVPGAFSRSFDGVGRVSGIVSAMKDFAHMDRRDKFAADLNRALQSTLTIARNEYKYVANMEVELGEIPPVVCHLSDLNQVFLNLIVNAAHAIGDVVGSSGDMGTIRVRTCDEGAFVRIDIADTGAGIPEAIRERVFEPFFTTKPIGVGSGQGLAIARSIVVDSHGGTLTFESEVGKGTSFHIRVPVGAQSASSDDL